MSKNQIEYEESSTYMSCFPANKEKRGIQQLFTQGWFGVITAIMLGLVTVATAWSGYQATRWDGEQSSRYADANTLRAESIRNSTLAGEVMLYDSNLFSNWLSAFSQGNTKLANLYEKRFRAEFRTAFQAWLATNPMNNPKAPPGPLSMPQHKVSLSEKAAQLAAIAEKEFDKGQQANDIGDVYVLNTVFLATVLFLVVIGERFEWKWVRALILLFAMGMFLFSLYHLITYPII